MPNNHVLVGFDFFCFFTWSLDSMWLKWIFRLFMDTSYGLWILCRVHGWGGSDKFCMGPTTPFQVHSMRTIKLHLSRPCVRLFGICLPNQAGKELAAQGDEIRPMTSWRSVVDVDCTWRQQSWWVTRQPMIYIALTVYSWGSLWATLRTIYTIQNTCPCRSASGWNGTWIRFLKGGLVSTLNTKYYIVWDLGF